MSPKKIVILDGTRSSDKHLDAILALLTDVLHKHESSRIQIFKLRDIKLNPCIGCFYCFIKTPGRCFHTDAGADILQAILKSDTVIFFTPVVFGGYSSELKKLADRLLPIALPFFHKVHGETHHPQRYSTFPRFVGIGVHPHPWKKLSDCFKILVGRNAINFYPSSYAAEVLNSTDAPELLRSQLQALFNRTDEFPLRDELISLMKNVSPVANISTENRRALFIVGSQKIKTSSTSAVLGGYLMEKFRKHGWKTESVNLEGNIQNNEGQSRLCSAVERAGMILILSPLYVDALPFLLTKALEEIASHRDTVQNGQVKSLLAVVNSGFPESYQNSVALAICRNFAIECGMTWAGGLALGAGECLVSGQPLTGFMRFEGLRWIWRPPLYHVVRALNITATALVKGKPIPEKKAMQLIAKTPIPLTPFAVWRWWFIIFGGKSWEQRAADNELNKNAIFDRPYAE